MPKLNFREDTQMFENQGELLLLDSFDMNRDDEIEYIVANQDKVRTLAALLCLTLPLPDCDPS